VTGLPDLDRASVEHRLITMRKAIGQLESIGPVQGARLRRDPAAGLAIERILALLGDLAFAINARVSGAVLGEVPPTPGAAFGAIGRVGVLDPELASALAPLDGPHHVLLQLSLDTEPDEAAAVVRAALAGYREYVRQVTGWIADVPAR
jgi:uncharacterized protein YutE (UPF0331/DUF86 family)